MDKQNTDIKLLKNELTAVVMLSLALAFRQMSMTIVSPFISTYSKALVGYTPMLAGLALGVFGLAQAVFQIPFGMLSDRAGNKLMMLIGLSQVVIGLIIAFFARNIYVLIIARALQGSGAIVGVGYSWVAEMVTETKRTKAMSIVGIFFSAAAALAFAIGPMLHEIMSINMMFLVCAVLIFMNEIYIFLFLKDSKERSPENRMSSKEEIRQLMKNKQFVNMNIGAFINNFMMMSVFYALPLYLSSMTGGKGLWKIFLPAVVAAVLLMKPVITLVDKGHSRHVTAVCFMVSSFSLFLYFKHELYIFLFTGTVLFLSCYVSLTTILATEANNCVTDEYRGLANGVFNSFQYIGNFTGPVVTGALWGISDRIAWVTVISAGIAGLLTVSRKNSWKSTNRQEV